VWWVAAADLRFARLVFQAWRAIDRQRPDEFVVEDIVTRL
jgi:hypothetical protein